ncbi:MAG TPA: hypothetical protein VLF39_03260 [Candidatus Saccharimonadales bacterium]|nr:hypothetical protein [Candidatus Saccharimonadales bacterium]
MEFDDIKPIEAVIEEVINAPKPETVAQHRFGIDMMTQVIEYKKRERLTRLERIYRENELKRPVQKRIVETIRNDAKTMANWLTENEIGVTIGRRGKKIRPSEWPLYAEKSISSVTLSYGESSGRGVYDEREVYYHVVGYVLDSNGDLRGTGLFRPDDKSMDKYDSLEKELDWEQRSKESASFDEIRNGATYKILTDSEIFPFSQIYDGDRGFSQVTFDKWRDTFINLSKQ